MKPRQLQFFLLEFTLSLVILSVALVVALNLFAVSAQQHTETLALRTLSQTLVQEAEWLRHPDSDWSLRYPDSLTSTTFDQKGVLSEDAVYTITVQRTVTGNLETATLTLIEEDTIRLTLEVVREITP
jgi:hypothetical protein